MNSYGYFFVATIHELLAGLKSLIGSLPVLNCFQLWHCSLTLLQVREWRREGGRWLLWMLQCSSAWQIMILIYCRGQQNTAVWETCRLLLPAALLSKEMWLDRLLQTIQKPHGPLCWSSSRTVTQWAPVIMMTCLWNQSTPTYPLLVPPPLLHSVWLDLSKCSCPAWLSAHWYQ